MPEALHLLNKYKGHKYFELSRALSDVGCEWVTRWVAEEYTGEPKDLLWALRIKTALFSKETIMLADEERRLDEIAHYLEEHPACKKWKFVIERRPEILPSGIFILMRHMKYEFPDSDAVRKAIADFGGDEEDIDYIFNVTLSDDYAYFPPSCDQCEAEFYAEVVNTGANRPASREEVIQVLDGIKGAMRRRADVGSKEEEKIAQIFEKIYDRWTGITEEEDTIRRAWKELSLTNVERHWAISKERFMQLAEEWKEAEVLFEPLTEKMTQDEVDELFNFVDASDEVTLDEKAMADFALLATLEGLRASSDGLRSLSKICGQDFVQAILDKYAELDDNP